MTTFYPQKWGVLKKILTETTTFAFSHSLMTATKYSGVKSSLLVDTKTLTGGINNTIGLTDEGRSLHTKRARNSLSTIDEDSDETISVHAHGEVLSIDVKKMSNQQGQVYLLKPIKSKYMLGKISEL